MRMKMVMPEGGVYSYALFRRSMANAFASYVNGDYTHFVVYLHQSLYFLNQDDYTEAPKPLTTDAHGRAIMTDFGKFSRADDTSGNGNPTTTTKSVRYDEVLPMSVQSQCGTNHEKCVDKNDDNKQKREDEEDDK